MYDNRGSGELAKKKKRLLEANELATKYYQQTLMKNTHALDYIFKTRGFSKEIVSDFRIGYAPNDGEGLTRILSSKGFTKKELSEAGLANRYGTDLFRGRMTVPLMDSSGQVIGFTGRILTDDDPKAPKYLNTPQTLLYDKSRHVFGLSQAKESIRKSDASVIVEGNLDVVSSHQAGVKNVVASAGTAMTEYHLKALSRLSHNVRLAFDADKAGLAATERAIPIAAKVGVELGIVRLPEGAKDPDELIQKDETAWERATNAAEPVVDWVLEEFSKREDLSSATGKRRFTTESLRIVRMLNDSIEREHYVKQIAKLTDSSVEAVQSKLDDTANTEQATKKSIKTELSSEATPQYAYQDDVLAALLIYPSLRYQLANYGGDIFVGEHRKYLANLLQRSSGELKAKELQPVATYVKIVELRAETRYDGWSDEDMSLEIAKLLRQTEVENKKRRKNELIYALRDAESAGDENLADDLRSQLSQLIKETA